MLKIEATAKFMKDIKRMEKRGYDLSLIREVLQLIAEGKSLPAKHRDHALTGNYKGFRECHILPDWLLVYAISENKLVLIAFRTGSHSDLF